MSKLFDVAVVGAGMTGRLLAVALHHSGFKTALVDRAEGGSPSDDGRTTALAFASVRLFKRLGLWDELSANAEPITDILVSNGAPRDRFRAGGLTGGQLHFPAAMLGGERMPDDAPALGYIVENKNLIAVTEKALAQSDVEEFRGSGVTGYAAPSQEGHGTLTLADGQAIETLVVAACDGKSSPLRAKMNLKALRWGYPQTAIIFNIDHEKPHGGVAHEVFYPDGPFAILPMPNNQCSIVWTERSEAAPAYMALSDEAFMEEARGRIGDHLGELSLANRRQSYPLSFLYAPKLNAERFVLAGDAAHGIHPIAGQGFNLGVKDVAALCHTLTEARDAGLDIGHGTTLARYDRWRRFDGAALAFGTDTLNRLFSNQFGPLAHARGLALGMVQRSDTARKFFMRVSGADLGDLPALMRPF